MRASGDGDDLYYGCTLDERHLTALRVGAMERSWGLETYMNAFKVDSGRGIRGGGTVPAPG